MAKRTIVKDKLKNGESITGELISVENGVVNLEKDGVQISTPIPEYLENILEDYEGEKITIKKVDNDFEIETED